ncbi:hypothetical protein [Bacteroides timonensis]|uniref:hypothetical protein n=1 Tax=Bacteroides timonensis TaxID=1470345 RepID=UPI0004BBF99B|nr:hypothetical protein [Bacteroides timonensis]
MEHSGILNNFLFILFPAVLAVELLILSVSFFRQMRRNRRRRRELERKSRELDGRLRELTKR